MIQEILTTARAFLGRELTQDQEAALTVLCETALEHWQGSLREGVTPEDCRGPFVTACALWALSHLLSALEAGTPAPRAFTAGDLTVSMGRTGENWVQTALRLGRQARELLADYTRDEGFVFREVAG